MLYYKLKDSRATRHHNDATLVLNKDAWTLSPKWNKRSAYIEIDNVLSQKRYIHSDWRSVTLFTKGPLVLSPPLVCSLIFQNFLDRKSKRAVYILKSHKGQLDVHTPSLHVFISYDLACIVLHEALLLKLNWMA